MTEPADRPRPRFDRFYEHMTERMDRGGLADLRSELLAGLVGEVAEIARVLRPGGAPAFLEHTRASSTALRLTQRIADATVWPLRYGGCRTRRDPLAAIGRADFDITDEPYLHYLERPLVPASSPVLGVARRARPRRHEPRWSRGLHC